MTDGQLLPEQATIIEVGPRDGFQAETAVLSTAHKLDVIRGLVASGLREIQVASFVHPRWVPQVADAEKVCEALPRSGNVRYVGLALNSQGVRRAYDAGIHDIEVSIAITETQSRRNANMSLDESITALFDMIDLADRWGMRVRAGLQCVWGCHGEQHRDAHFLPGLTRRIFEAGVDSLSLADSTGFANPRSVTETVSRVLDEIGDTPLVLHFHDTRGLALANMFAALQLGVTHFDTSVAGMGGCPFIPGATGNVATSDAVYMLESMGVSTGISLTGLADVAALLETLYGKPFPGIIQRLMRDSGSEAVAL
jgi:hydroxymethylglutaryl-CoA lyase